MIVITLSFLVYLVPKICIRALYSLIDISKYQADAHILQLNNVDVFSDGGDSVGLSFSIDIDLIYFIKQEEVGALHRDLAKNYADIVRSRTTDAIKNSAISVPFTDYFQNRVGVEKQFRDAVQKRWNDPPQLHVTLDQFYLGRIRIPESVARKQLEARVQNERNDKEKFLQESRLERERTAVDVNKIELKRDKLLRETNAEASKITANANALAEKIKSEALNNGTMNLLDSVDITTQNQTIAYTYIRNLQNRENLDLRDRKSVV